MWKRQLVLTGAIERTGVLVERGEVAEVESAGSAAGPQVVVNEGRDLPDVGVRKDHAARRVAPVPGLRVLFVFELIAQRHHRRAVPGYRRRQAITAVAKRVAEVVELGQYRV